MSAPSPRLLWLTALLVVPVATLAGLYADLTGPCLLLLAVMASLALTDWAGSRSRLRSLAVTVPPVVHATKGRDFILDLEITSPGRACSRLRLGMAFPQEFRPALPWLVVDFPKGESTVRESWAITALKRGRYTLDRLYVETPSRLGLWTLRSSLPVSLEIRCYPDLRRERRRLAALFLNRNGTGLHTQRQVGKGREFDHLREYVAGDDYGDIHWKSSARRGQPITKTFQIERTREVCVLIDYSRLSARETKIPVSDDDSTPDRVVEDGTGGEFEITTHLEKALQSALILGLAAEQQRDHFGLVTFADQVTRFLRPGNGTQHYNTCRDSLYTLEPKIVAPNFEELFTFIRKRLTRRSLLVILTDLSDPLQAENFCEHVHLISRQHLVVAHMIRPGTARPLFSRTDVTSTSDLYDDLGGHFLWHDLQEVARVLARQNVHLSLPEAADLTADVVTNYMNVKRRQVL